MTVSASGPDDLDTSGLLAEQKSGEKQDGRPRDDARGSSVVQFLRDNRTRIHVCSPDMLEATQ